jgi:ABC-2 type transport system permease protein
VKGYLKLSITELKLFLRQPLAIFFTVLFPLLLLGIFGVIYGNEQTDFFGGHGYIDTMAPAFIGLIAAMTGFTSIPGVVASYREKGVLRRLKASPVSSRTVLFSWITVYIFTTLVAVAVMITFSTLVFGLRFHGNALQVALFSILSMISVFSLGFVIASLSPTVRTAEAVGMGIYFPMILLSGTTLPIQMMPDTLKKMIAFLPLTHVVQLLQGSWFGSPWQDNALNLGVICGMAVVGIFVSSATFRWE